MSTATTTPEKTGRLEPQALPENIDCIQPGRGWVMRLELAWGRLRRCWLRAVRPAYVARMQSVRRGECANCPHDIVDSRDLKFYRNVCGFRFDDANDRFRWRSRLMLARWGLAEVVVYAGGMALLALGLLSAALVGGPKWLAVTSVLPAGLAVFIVSFFRDPVRRVPEGMAVVVSPADGKIDEMTELDYCDFIEGPALKIGIFLSVFSVHINRVPETSRVIEVRYRRGKFGNAMRLDTAQDNEQICLMLEGTDPAGRRMIVKQIVGAIARRIVCEVRPGDVLPRGEKYGMIKFGSRTELYLPREGLCVVAKLNQRVRGGHSVLARFTNHEATP